MAFPVLHHLIILFTLVLARPAFSQNNQNVSLGSFLLASDDSSSSWRSPSGDFAFGFRRLDNKNLFLLAIWFDKIPDKTLVWFANGENPAPGGSKIELTADGDFTLNDPQGQVLWKVDGVFTNAAMLDTGNFVLANRSSDNYGWESFKNPFDTILPTQVLEVGGMLSSRQTENSYSKGRFQLRLLPDGNLVLNTIGLPTEFAYAAYYHSHTYDGADVMNCGYLTIFNESGYMYVKRRNGNIVNLTSGNIVPPRDFYFRATLDHDGIFTQYAHPKSPRNGTWDRTWFTIWSAPDDICSRIEGDLGSGACGYNSYCVLDFNRRPLCECPPGFSFSDPNNKFNGCKQDRIQKCDDGPSKPEDFYEMHVLPNTFWPTSNFEWLQPLNEDDCSRSCLHDCNCVVAISVNGSCRKKKLPLSNGRVDRNSYGKALIKLPKFDVSSGEDPLPRGSNTGKKDQGTLILVGSILLGSSVFLNLMFVATISLVVLGSFQNKRKLPRVSSISETNLRSFTYEYLREATDGFREELGRGAFGIVYKGIISSTTARNIVAVKKLDRMVQEREIEFKTEARAIAKTHHRNLVRLLGYCDEGPHRLLVYEFMSNGTLASFLFGLLRPDWNIRIQMASGIARGLMYLHEECSTQIIHCDIKPQNILLDDAFVARISDFGLAKLLMGDQTRTHTAIRGTRGYVAPEWFRNMPITAKVDVYSYGVMLLEIICCRRSMEIEREKEEEIILTDWVYDCYNYRRLEKLVVDDEEARNDMGRVKTLVMVAIWCVQEDPSLRPSMKTVTQMLEGVIEVPTPPCPTPLAQSDGTPH
ncbi:G-type lectin S-receptor-like serine/threonine-protein kinase LECRK4 [Malania oleifera]|uniref:G-type lectin S-receptor-like serine/threonine-protein kinase LECRK4 n=1 Tax=Malania oleifera TaxID=397392 RepID=UPI0025ADDA07|nr:G-type lectin S-receptor-like serine/threonine-protein kinase LECRK4 [Malania oleifera]